MKPEPEITLTKEEWIFVLKGLFIDPWENLFNWFSDRGWGLVTLLEFKSLPKDQDAEDRWILRQLGPEYLIGTALIGFLLRYSMEKGWFQEMGVAPQKLHWVACLLLAGVLSWPLVACMYLNLKLTFVWAWNRRAKRLRDQARIKRFKNRSIDRLAQARKSFQDSPIPTWKTFKN